MKHRSPLNFDISVTADKQRRARARGMSGAVGREGQPCGWPGCERNASYRAPVSPDRLREFRWFCLDHVRAYNSTWNFFAGWTEDDLDRQAVADRTWERPTWAFRERVGKRPEFSPHTDGQAWARFGFSDPLDVLGDAATRNPGQESEKRTRFRRLTRDEARAMDVLGLPHEIEDRAEVRTRYRELVKDLHPDMNGGHRGDEGRLARVIRAWEILRGSQGFRD